MAVRGRQQAEVSGGIGLGGAVFLVLLVMKLLGKISLSWWWVTLPLWGPVAALLLVAAVAGAVALVVAAVNALWKQL